MKLLKLSDQTIQWFIKLNRSEFDEAYKVDSNYDRMKECIKRAYELGCKAHIEDLECDMPQINVAPVVVESCGVLREYY